MTSGAKMLRDWMERRGLNQAETAVELGIHFTFISQIVNGKRVPGRENAVKIERETGIPVEAWSSSRRDSTRRRQTASANVPQ